MLRAAAENPDIGLIGCEPFINGLAKTLSRIQTLGLANIRLYAGDAADLISWLPSGSLGRVFLFFPDPWPKRRQRKRRFLSEKNLVALALAMRSGAELRFATDIDDYSGWTLARVLRSPDFIWPAERSDDWNRPWEGWRETRYEAKARQAGHRAVYLTFFKRTDQVERVQPRARAR